MTTTMTTTATATATATSTEIVTTTDNTEMKAAFINSYGSDVELTIGAIAKPQIKPDQVLIKVAAAGVNPVDFHVRNGMMADSGSHSLPLVLGWDAAGTISACGSGVSHLHPGDEVFVFAPIDQQGCQAEYLAVDANLVVARPDSLSLQHSAAVPLAATTAYQGLMRDAQLQAGQTVLILGGSGGVGGFAVQIAKAMGARVIATTSERNMAYVKSLGADDVINYQQQAFDDVVGRVDAVFITTSGDNAPERAVAITKPGGRVVSTLDDMDDAIAQAGGVLFKRMWVEPDATDLKQIRNMIDQHQIRVTLDSVFPLAQANDAIKRSESARAVGKIIITLA